MKLVMKFNFYISGKSKEQENKRINKELANIRSKFKGAKLGQLLIFMILHTHLLDNKF